MRGLRVRILAIAYALPVFYLGWSLFWGKRAPANPWQATGLEWQTPSPPPVHNFAATPVVTRGPYHWLRHPIYAAILYFIWSTAVDHRSVQSLAAALLVTAGAGVRMYAEESLLMTTYPEYAAYRARTARVIPFVL